MFEYIVGRGKDPLFVQSIPGIQGKSERVILPKNGCRVKVTKFLPEAGDVVLNIQYPYDETIYVESGKIKLSFERRQEELGAGDTCHILAGTSYNFVAASDAQVLCFFSAGADGILPEDEKIPRKSSS